MGFTPKELCLGSQSFFGSFSIWSLRYQLKTSAVKLSQQCRLEDRQAYFHPSLPSSYCQERTVSLMKFTWTTYIPMLRLSNCPGSTSAANFDEQILAQDKLTAHHVGFHAFFFGSLCQDDYIWNKTLIWSNVGGWMEVVLLWPLSGFDNNKLWSQSGRLVIAIS